MTRPLHLLVPNIEHRLEVWERIQQKLHEAPQLKPRPTVTLSRSFGCEGFPVAERVRAALEADSGEPWNLYDKSLLEAVHHDEGVSMRVLRNLGLSASRLEKLGLAPAEYYEQVRAFDAIGKHIVQVASGGNAVIVGRGGAVLCRDMTNCFHFRLDAPFAWRVENIALRMQLPKEEAAEFVKANGSRRDEFAKSQLKADTSDPLLYDAVFNNARHGAAEISAAIVAYVKDAWARASGVRPEQARP